MLRKCKSFVVYFGFCGSTFSKKIYQFIFFPKLIDKALKTLVFRGYEICAKHLNIFNFLYKNKIHLLDLITFIYESCLLSLTEKKPVDTKHHISYDKRAFKFKIRFTIHVYLLFRFPLYRCY